MKLASRITAIKKKLKPAMLGYRTFVQDGDIYYDETYEPVDYRRGLFQISTEGRRRYSNEEITALEQSGWHVTIVQFVSDWRDHSNVLAVDKSELVHSFLQEI